MNDWLEGIDCVEEDDDNDEFGPLLTSEQLYRRDLEELTYFIDKREIEARVDQAQKEGSDMRELLIYYCLPIVLSYATRLHDHRIPLLELVSVGNFSLIETMDRALLHVNPVGYLLRFAYGRMSRYRLHFQSLIITPSTPGEQPHKVFSLLDNHDTSDSDIAEKHPEITSDIIDVASPLHAAVEVLSPARKRVMRLLLGMDGPPETMEDIAGGNSTTKEYQLIRVTKQDALIYMRRYLQKHYPDFVRQHVREVTIPYRVGNLQKYIHVQIPQCTLYKLECAWQRLMAGNEKISAHKLRVLTGVNSRYASAFFHLKTSTEA